MKTKYEKRLVCLALCLLMLSGNALAVEQGYTVFHGDREKARIALTVDDATIPSMWAKSLTCAKPMTCR